MNHRQGSIAHATNFDEARPFEFECKLSIHEWFRLSRFDIRVFVFDSGSFKNPIWFSQSNWYGLIESLGHGYI